MDSPVTLLPKKGHQVDLAFLCLMLAGLSFLSSYILYDWTVLDGQEGRRLLPAVLVMIPFVLAFLLGLGRYVVFDSQKGVSPPLVFRRKAPSFIPLSAIRSFARIRAVGPAEKPVGIIIVTEDGRRFRYSDRRTPGCVAEMLAFLSEHEISEQVPSRPTFGWRL